MQNTSVVGTHILEAAYAKKNKYLRRMCICTCTRFRFLRYIHTYTAHDGAEKETSAQLLLLLLPPYYNALFSPTIFFDDPYTFRLLSIHYTQRVDSPSS